jgi:DNA-binding CsgD family transcriptional regulator
VKSAILRPRDSDALRAELRAFASTGQVPVAFGGEVHDGMLLLSEFFGTRTAGLRGLAVQPHSGLGGFVVAERRPISVANYKTSSSITHDYDRPVLGEGLASIVAVPVLVDGMPRAVLYGAERTTGAIGDRTAELLVASARRLSLELKIRDEVDRRLRMQEMLDERATDSASTEQLREIQADLRRIAADPAVARHVKQELLSVSERIARISSGDAPESDVSLAPRELDVLSLVALGCTNAEAAEHLSLTAETVKSYLRSASTKLGSRTRHDAVAKARRAGLLA